MRVCPAEQETRTMWTTRGGTSRRLAGITVVVGGPTAYQPPFFRVPPNEMVGTYHRVDPEQPVCEVHQFWVKTTRGFKRRWDQERPYLAYALSTEFSTEWRELTVDTEWPKKFFRGSDWAVASYACAKELDRLGWVCKYGVIYIQT